MQTIQPTSKKEYTFTSQPRREIPSIKANEDYSTLFYRFRVNPQEEQSPSLNLDPQKEYTAFLDSRIIKLMLRQRTRASLRKNTNFKPKAKRLEELRINTGNFPIKKYLTAYLENGWIEEAPDLMSQDKFRDEFLQVYAQYLDDFRVYRITEKGEEKSVQINDELFHDYQEALNKVQDSLFDIWPPTPTLAIPRDIAKITEERYPFEKSKHPQQKEEPTTTVTVIEASPTR